tara:strand:+ start:573 stop:734 length:162 start_codon:yes stop_codon:yes gene_type:complete
MSHRFTVPIEENDFGDSVITIPENIMLELGWEVDDQLDYDIIDDKLILKKYNE